MTELKSKKINLDERTTICVSLDNNTVLKQRSVYVFMMCMDENGIDYTHGILTKEHYQVNEYANARYDELVNLWEALTLTKTA